MSSLIVPGTGLQILSQVSAKTGLVGQMLQTEVWFLLPFSVPLTTVSRVVVKAGRISLLVFIITLLDTVLMN